MPEENDKPEKLRPRFFLLAALLVLFFAGLWWLIFWAAFRITPTEIHWNDIYLSWIEKWGPHLVIVHAIVFFILPIAVFLFILYKKSHAFEKSRTRQLYWLHLTIAALTGLLVSLLCWYLVFRRSVGDHFASHSFYYNVLARSILCTGLLLVGILLYLFKKHLKIFYGLSQIVIAILSNLTLLQKSNLTHMPARDLSSLGLFAFAAFTFLLSKGVSDVVEGVQERIVKIPDKPPIPAQISEPETPKAHTP
ncbi:hypothetical protein RBB79_09750 [Tunturiibacter empetritectus]|uniref:Membrane-associated HD superfamily phosphohydrolase n=2 Tax=Tunturiibacter TaxID=3154218 RepID=A0A852VI13_9BACT|nr:hypothetical protein [Edaphobacter lichenicola]NYF89835.1 membrane-associated HD superfamily phosphohydrolase [Edaphobacter lichenicola]